MLMQKEIEEQLALLKPEMALAYHVSKIGYFGSYARNQQTDISDLDILVEFSSPIGWEIFDLKDMLERVLELKVDLVTPNALKRNLRERILSEVKYV